MTPLPEFLQHFLLFFFAFNYVLLEICQPEQEHSIVALNEIYRNKSKRKKSFTLYHRKNGT